MRVKQPNDHYNDPRQRGAAVIETSLVFIALWLICGLVLEFTYSQSVRQIAQLALYEAARTGSVAGAHPEKIEQTFRHAILPLFAPKGAQDSTARRRDTSAQRFSHATGLSLWHIETLNPDAAVYTDFADPDLSSRSNRPTLRRDYLAEQHEAHIKKGWQDGRGPASGKTVFNANTLRLQLSLLYRPRTPGIAFILKKLGAHRSDRTGLAWQKGYLEAKLVTEVMMQSHAQMWSATRKNDNEVVRQRGDQVGRQDDSRVGRQEMSLSVSGQIKQYPTSIHVAAHPHAVRLPLTEQSNALEITSADTTQDAAKAHTSGSDATIEENNLCNGLLCCQ